MQTLGQAHELHAAAGFRDCGKRAHELAEAGAVDVIDVRHVQQDVLMALVHEAVDLVLDLQISLGKGDLAGKIEHFDVTSRAFGNLHGKLLVRVGAGY
jgi:hypothetical protein